MFVALMFFFVFYFSDTFKNRYNLVLACALMIFANLIAYFGIVIGAIVEPDIPRSAILQFLPVIGLSAVMYWYFRIVCKDYSLMHNG